MDWFERLTQFQESKYDCARAENSGSGPAFTPFITLSARGRFPAFTLSVHLSARGR